jgi:hypothetical protein
MRDNFRNRCKNNAHTYKKVTLTTFSWKRIRLLVTKYQRVTKSVPQIRPIKKIHFVFRLLVNVPLLSWRYRISSYIYSDCLHKRLKFSQNRYCRFQEYSHFIAILWFGPHSKSPLFWSYNIHSHRHRSITEKLLNITNKVRPIFQASLRWKSIHSFTKTHTHTLINTDIWTNRRHSKNHFSIFRGTHICKSFKISRWVYHRHNTFSYLGY